jgi:hypothetical protein
MQLVQEGQHQQDHHHCLSEGETEAMIQAKG